MKKIAFIADPIPQMKSHKDTSFSLIRAALKLGIEVYHIDQNDIDLEQDKAVAECALLKLETEQQIIIKKDVHMYLSEFQQIWIRKDPPFDRRYFYTSLQCDYVGKNTTIVNHPQVLRDWNEKLAAHYYPEYQPKTFVSLNQSRLIDFINKIEDAVLKPIDGFGGKGILFTNKNDPKVLEKLRSISKEFSEKIIVQEAVPEAELGDKRVLIFNGKVLGAILRVHKEGSKINNLDAGGTAVKTGLTNKQRDISERLAKDFLERGVYFAGIDFLGDFLIEINITSPTGLQELEKFEGIDFSKEIMSTDL
ncbi:MAG: glutathione synthase [Bdellovibrionota bacterium]|nr:glutathione synthase [Bdellovibrionota bacterium]